RRTGRSRPEPKEKTMSSRKLTTRLNLTPLEDRAVPTTFPTSYPMSSLSPLTSGLTSGQVTPVPLTTPSLLPAPMVHNLAVGYGTSASVWRVRLYQSLSQFQDFQAYDLLAGEADTIHVAVGDVNGDGVPDVITGMSPVTLLGIPVASQLEIFDGAALGQSSPRLIRSLNPFGPLFTGGL